MQLQYGQAQVCSQVYQGGHQGSSVDRPCQPFSFDQVLAYTESATSEYLTTSQCHSALLPVAG